MKAMTPKQIHALEIQNLCTAQDAKAKLLYTELEQIEISCFEINQTDTCCSLIIFDNNTCYDDLVQPVIQRFHQGFKILLLYLGEEKFPFYKSWELLNHGAEDILFDTTSSRLAKIIKQRLQRWEMVETVVQSNQVSKIAIGTSKAWTDVLRQVVDTACFSQNNILLMGETGTGKEMIARMIHDLDQRKEKGELVLLDCTTIVSSLSGSEFFGHEKGAYTNAISTREGAFALADGGTLFLDEIGELPLPLQAELLRVIQEGTYKRVGSNQWRKTNFRLICATNRDLKHEVEQGRFRADLYEVVKM